MYSFFMLEILKVETTSSTLWAITEHRTLLTSISYYTYLLTLAHLILGLWKWWGSFSNLFPKISRPGRFPFTCFVTSYTHYSHSFLYFTLSYWPELLFISFKQTMKNSLKGKKKMKLRCCQTILLRGPSSMG